MADKLIVRDFGPIKNAELDIKKTTVLIGPQGSGKSTLAKLVACFNTLENKEEFDSASFVELLSSYGIGSSYLDANTYLKHSPVQISFDNSITFEKSEISYSYRRIRESIRGSDFTSYKHFYVPSERSILPLIAKSILGLLSTGVSIPKFILEFGRVYELARDNVRSLYVNYLKVRYSHMEGREYIVDDSEIHTLFSESASGYQSVFPLKLVIENNKKYVENFFIIEEPELNIYPTTQKNLVYDLTDSCLKRDGRLLLTTHSPYVLSSLNNLLFAYKVAQKHPDLEDDIAHIIPKESWLNPEDFAAYFVADGTVRSIVNPKTGLISENELDGVSENIGDEFDALMEIYSEKANEGSY